MHRRNSNFQSLNCQNIPPQYFTLFFEPHTILHPYQHLSSRKGIINDIKPTKKGMNNRP